MDDHRYVTRLEWEQYHKHQDALNLAGRLDRLERVADRFTGPIIAIVVGVGALGAGASVVTAFVVVANALNGGA